MVDIVEDLGEDGLRLGEEVEGVEACGGPEGEGEVVVGEEVEAGGGRCHSVTVVAAVFVELRLIRVVCTLEKRS